MNRRKRNISSKGKIFKENWNSENFSFVGKISLLAFFFSLTVVEFSFLLCWENENEFDEQSRIQRISGISSKCSAESVECWATNDEFRRSCRDFNRNVHEKQEKKIQLELLIEAEKNVSMWCNAVGNWKIKIVTEKKINFRSNYFEFSLFIF